MNKSSYLLLIYSDLLEFNTNKAAIELKQIITETNYISIDEMKDFSESNFKHEMPNLNFPCFSSIEEFDKLAFKLCDALQKERAILLSIQDLNPLIENCEGRAQLLEAMIEKGNEIKNVDLIEKKKGFFTKFLGN